MRRFPDSVYALNENLLDDADTDEVTDDVDVEESVVYRFMFHFKCDYSAAIAKNVFFKTAMEPALGRLKSSGLVESWNFIKKSGSAKDVPNLDTYTRRVRSTNNLKQIYGKGAVLSVDVTIPKSAENADDIVTISAHLFQYAAGCRLDSDGGLRMAFWKQDSEIIYSVFFENGWRWTFHCGQHSRNSNSGCKKFAGMFVRMARNMGFMEAVDDARSRFIAYSFGLSDGDDKMFMFDSDGNCMFESDVDLYRVSFGKFNEYGLLLVQFAISEYNFLKMDGSNLTYDFDTDYSDFSEGYFKISKRKNSGGIEDNLIDKDGNLLLKDWCVYIENFVDGIAVLSRYDDKLQKCVNNFIDKSGKPVLSDWYDSVDFDSPNIDSNVLDPNRKRVVARISNYDMEAGKRYYNYADRNGNILLTDWLRGDCSVMVNGFAKVCKFTETESSTSNKYNYMREDGSLVCKTWFNGLAGWPERGMFAAQTGDGWVFMDTDTCNALFDGTVFKYVEEESGSDGFDYYKVQTFPELSFLNGFVNLISPDGKMCCDKMEYASMTYIGNGFADVRKKIFSESILWKWGAGPVDIDKGLTSINPFRENYAMVFSREQKNLIDADGNLVSDTWFGYVGDIDGGFVGVQIKSTDGTKSDVWDLLACKTGVLLFGGSGTTFIHKHYVISPDEVVAVQSVKDNRFVYNMFDVNGNQLLDEWTTFPIAPAGDGLVRIGPNSFADYSGKPVSLI